MAMEVQRPLARIEPPPGSLAEASGMISRAIERGLDGAALASLFAVYRDMQQHAAQAAFAQAFASFQAECPAMPRGHVHTQFSRVNRAGVKVPGRYSDLADIGATIAPILARHQLAYDWEDTELLSIDGIACYRAHMRIRHALGHSERKSGPPVPLGQPVMSREGKAVQSASAHASAVITTAKRLSLLAAFGLWSIDPDEEDAAEAAQVVETLTEAQALQIEDLLNSYADACGDPAAREAMRGKLVGAFGVETLAEIPADKFDGACRRLVEHVDAARERAKRG